MGNKSIESTPISKNWRYISKDLIRNELTSELIQEHILYFDTNEQVLCEKLFMNKRIRLQHPAVLKLIYFDFYQFLVFIDLI